MVNGGGSIILERMFKKQPVGPGRTEVLSRMLLASVPGLGAAAIAYKAYRVVSTAYKIAKVAKSCGREL